MSCSQPIKLCAKTNKPSLSQNSPSLPQNSVRLSALLRNSTLETVFRPFPILRDRHSFLRSVELAVWLPRRLVFVRTFLHVPGPTLNKHMSGKTSTNINFLVRISCGHSCPLRPDAQGSKSFSPSPGAAGKPAFVADGHDFRRGRP